MVDFNKLLKKNRAARALAGAGVDVNNIAFVAPEANDQFTEAINRLLPDEPAPPSEIILSEEQERVVASAMGRQNILITGSAGTGKSTLLKELVRRCDGRLPVTASTGIAAVNVGGMTIHSFAGLGLADEPAEDIAEKIMDRKAVRDRLCNFNRIAIDEISMISAELLNKLDAVLKIIRRNSEPFGAMQILAFGDFLQLPPVTRGETPEGRFAFESKAWKAAGFKVAMLRQVFRQQDREFSEALNDIRVGNVSEKARALLVSRFKQPDPDPSLEPVVVHTTNADVDALNAERLDALPAPELEWRSFDQGEPAQIAMLRKHCIWPEFLRLRVGAQVMLLKNLDVEAGLANGSIGKVIEMPKKSEDGGPKVEFRNGAKLEIGRHRIEIKMAGKIMATREQLPLRLAWSITTHKSQGMTLDKIRVHLGNVFEDGQAYVALSRARSLPGLFIESTAKGCIRASREAVRFYEEAASL